MASDEPLDDRCGASVMDRVGLEVHDHEQERVFTDDESLQSVRIERGAVETTKEADYQAVISHLRNGFSVAQVIVEDGDGDTEVIDVLDDDPDVRHRETDLVGYCERYPMDNGRCYVHGGAGGSGKHESKWKSNMETGLYAKRSNYYKSLDQDEQAFVEAMTDSWIENAPFDRGNKAKINEVYRIAIDQHRLWAAHDEFDDGLVYEQVIGVTDDGEPISVDEENPANLAYDRLDRTSIRKLKELGCLDSPEDRQADATESLAEKFADLNSP